MTSGELIATGRWLVLFESGPQRPSMQSLGLDLVLAVRAAVLVEPAHSTSPVQVGALVATLQRCGESRMRLLI